MAIPSGMSLSMKDYSDEHTSVGFFLPAMTALNYASVVAARDALEAAVNDVTACNIVSSAIVVAQEELAYVAPTDPFAQREIGLRVTIEDTVTHTKSTITIGGARLNLLAQVGTDVVDPASAEWIALAAAITNNAVSYAGNPVRVVGGRIVGRAS
jgi:hypothetical protein